MAGIAFGSFDDSFSLASPKAYLAEFISTLLFVFAGVGSAIAYGKLTSDAALDTSALVAIAVCHGFALFVAVAIGANISGGHVKPKPSLLDLLSVVKSHSSSDFSTGLLSFSAPPPLASFLSSSPVDW
ncbi:hypothetical protein F2Q69_00003572 [Brassica cretica]|uniref:Aquaporin n=1 Tax=Brassica cretica TaxID=69181 RepID=A0A8S9PA93_BRACR|nr:hypothetical protein F2Q69_00003572 [Brassica cretica]